MKTIKDLEDKISEEKKKDDIDELEAKISRVDDLLQETINLLNSNQGDKEELEENCDKLYSLRAKYKMRLIALRIEALEQEEVNA